MLSRTSISSGCSALIGIATKAKFFLISISVAGTEANSVVFGGALCCPALPRNDALLRASAAGFLSLACPFFGRPSIWIQERRPLGRSAKIRARPTPHRLRDAFDLNLRGGIEFGSHPQALCRSR